MDWANSGRGTEAEAIVCGHDKTAAVCYLVCMKRARAKTADTEALDDIAETLKRVPKTRLGVVRELVHALARPLATNGKRKARAQKKVSLLDTPLCGLWADREDITDSSTFARELRAKVEARGDQRKNVR